MNPLFIAGAQATKHAIMRTVSVLAVLLVVAGIGFSVWRVFNPKPTESYAQVVQAGGSNFNIEVYTPEDTFFLGIRIFGFKFGLSKPTVKKIGEIAKEAKTQ